MQHLGPKNTYNKIETELDKALFLVLRNGTENLGSIIHMTSIHDPKGWCLIYLLK
jgi:hypothetical protein